MNPKILFHFIKASFYSRRFYQAVGIHGKGFGLRFLLLLSILLAVPMTAGLVSHTAHITESASDPEQTPNKLTQPDAYLIHTLLSKLPDMVLTQGVIATEVEQPHYIKDPETDQTIAVIDTEGTVAALPHGDAAILLKKDAFQLRIPGTDAILERPYPENESPITVTSEAAFSFFGLLQGNLKWLFFLQFFPTSALFAFAYAAFFAFCYGGIGSVIFSIGSKRKLSFQTYVRLAAFAQAPILIIEMLIRMAPFFSTLQISDIFAYLNSANTLTLHQYFSMLVTVGYVTFAIHANRGPILRDVTKQD